MIFAEKPFVDKIIYEITGNYRLNVLIFVRKGETCFFFVFVFKFIIRIVLGVFGLYRTDYSLASKADQKDAFCSFFLNTNCSWQMNVFGLCCLIACCVSHMQIIPFGLFRSFRLFTHNHYHRIKLRRAIEQTKLVEKWIFHVLSLFRVYFLLFCRHSTEIFIRSDRTANTKMFNAAHMVISCYLSLFTYVYEMP